MVKHTKKPFFLFDQPVALDDGDETLSRLLGLAVVDPFNPTTVAYSPDKPLRPQDAISDLYPQKPVTCTGFKLSRSKSSEGGAFAQLQSLVKVSLGHGGSQQETFDAALFRRFSMDNTLRRLQDLLREPTKDTPGSEATHSADHAEQLKTRARYRKEVLDLLHAQKEGKLYIITGFMTCLDPERNSDRSRNTSAGVGAGTGPTALSGGVQAQGEIKYSRSHDFGVQGAYVGEYLVACSYFPLYARESSKIGWLEPVAWIFGKEKNYALGSEELWYLGDKPAKGNLEGLLGKGASGSASPTEDISGDEEGMAVKLLYPDSDEESEDETAEHEDGHEADDADRKETDH